MKMPMERNRNRRFWRSAMQCLLGSLAVALLTFVCFRLRVGLTIASLLYMTVVVLLAFVDAFAGSVFVSVISVLLLDYYFAPPIFSLQLNDPLDIVALVVFLGTALLITRVVSQRKRAEEALRQAQMDLAHASRLTTLGEFTASLAHEVKQPIAAVVTDANTCVRWIARDQPDLTEAREAAWRIVKGAKRASEIINRVGLLFKKGTPQRELVDVNEVAREMIVLLRNEASRHSISIRTELAEDLPDAIGDRVQLQQVLMNLIVNGIEAMHDVDRPRELTIKSQSAQNNELLLSVSDTGMGLPRHQADEIFDAFFTTKTHGTGMGLRISRSIVESHGGRLWAADNSPRGASFCFTLPTKTEAQE